MSYWWKYYDRKLNFDTDYNSGQHGLQNGAACRDYKSGQVQILQNGAKILQIKSRQGLQNEAKRLQIGQGLQIGAEQSTGQESF